MRSGRAGAEAEPLGLTGEGLDMARHRIVALVAMQVDHQPAPGGDLAQRLHRSRSVRHRALEMRDAADDVDAEVERALEVARRGWGPEIAVLRKGDELQVEIGFHLLFHLDERFDRDQPVVAHVDMTANGEQALRDGEIAVGERALRHRFVGEMRLEFAPERDSLEQRAGDVEAGKAKRQRRVQVKVAIDERAAREGSRARRSPAAPRP